MIQKIMEPYAFGYGVGLASKSDVSPNTQKVDEVTYNIVNNGDNVNLL